MTKDVLKTTTKKTIKNNTSAISKIARPQRSAALSRGEKLLEIAESSENAPIFDLPATTTSPVVDLTESTIDWAQQLQQTQMAQARQLAEQQQQMAETQKQLADLFAIMQENKELKQSLEKTQSELAAALAEIAQLKAATLTPLPQYPRNIDNFSDAELADAFPLLSPDLQFTQGTNASKHADALYVPTGISAKEATPYLEATKKVVPAKVKSRKLSAKQRQSLSNSLFNPPRPISEQTEAVYRYVYLPNKYRHRLSVYRNKLRKLGIDNGRVLDIHYPTRGVVALLIHTGYHQELLAILSKYKVEPLGNFDPLSATNITDPELLQLSEDKRKIKAEEFHHVRLLRALKHVREYMRSSVARDFHFQGWLSKEQIATALKTPVDSATSADNAAASLFATVSNTNDVVMNETATTESQ